MQCEICGYPVPLGGICNTCSDGTAALLFRKQLITQINNWREEGHLSAEVADTLYRKIEAESNLLYLRYPKKAPTGFIKKTPPAAPVEAVAAPVEAVAAPVAAPAAPVAAPVAPPLPQIPVVPAQPLAKPKTPPVEAIPLPPASPWAHKAPDSTPDIGSFLRTRVLWVVALALTVGGSVFMAGTVWQGLSPLFRDFLVVGYMAAFAIAATALGHRVGKTADGETPQRWLYGLVATLGPIQSMAASSLFGLSIPAAVASIGVVSALQFALLRIVLPVLDPNTRKPLRSLNALLGMSVAIGLIPGLGTWLLLPVCVFGLVALWEALVRYRQFVTIHGLLLFNVALAIYLMEPPVAELGPVLSISALFLLYADVALGRWRRVHRVDFSGVRGLGALALMLGALVLFSIASPLPSFFTTVLGILFFGAAALAWQRPMVLVGSVVASGLGLWVIYSLAPFQALSAWLVAMSGEESLPLGWRALVGLPLAAFWGGIAVFLAQTPWRQRADLARVAGGAAAVLGAGMVVVAQFHATSALVLLTPLAFVGFGFRKRFYGNEEEADSPLVMGLALLPSALVGLWCINLVRVGLSPWMILGVLAALPWLAFHRRGQQAALITGALLSLTAPGFLQSPASLLALGVVYLSYSLVSGTLQEALSMGGWLFVVLGIGWGIALESPQTQTLVLAILTLVTWGGSLALRRLEKHRQAPIAALRFQYLPMVVVAHLAAIALLGASQALQPPLRGLSRIPAGIAVVSWLLETASPVYGFCICIALGVGIPLKLHHISDMRISLLMGLGVVLSFLPTLVLAWPHRKPAFRERFPWTTALLMPSMALGVAGALGATAYLLWGGQSDPLAGLLVIAPTLIAGVLGELPVVEGVGYLSLTVLTTATALTGSAIPLGIATVLVGIAAVYREQRVRSFGAISIGLAATGTGLVTHQPLLLAVASISPTLLAISQPLARIPAALCWLGTAHFAMEDQHAYWHFALDSVAALIWIESREKHLLVGGRYLALLATLAWLTLGIVEPPAFFALLPGLAALATVGILWRSGDDPVRNTALPFVLPAAILQILFLAGLPFSGLILALVLGLSATAGYFYETSIKITNNYGFLLWSLVAMVALVVQTATMTLDAQLLLPAGILMGLNALHDTRPKTWQYFWSLPFLGWALYLAFQPAGLPIAGSLIMVWATLFLLRRRGQNIPLPLPPHLEEGLAAMGLLGLPWLSTPGTIIAALAVVAALPWGRGFLALALVPAVWFAPIPAACIGLLGGIISLYQTIQKKDAAAWPWVGLWWGLTWAALRLQGPLSDLPVGSELPLMVVIGIILEIMGAIFDRQKEAYLKPVWNFAGVLPWLGLLAALPGGAPNWMWLTAGGALFGLRYVFRAATNDLLLAICWMDAALMLLLWQGGIVDPLLYVGPLSLSVLALAQRLRAQMNAATLQFLRYTAAGSIVLVGFVQTLGDPSRSAVVLFLAVVGVIAGTLLRIRAFLYLGAGSIAATLSYLLLRVGFAHGELWAFYLTGMGVLLLGGLITFSVQRERLSLWRSAWETRVRDWE